MGIRRRMKKVSLLAVAALMSATLVSAAPAHAAITCAQPTATVHTPAAIKQPVKAATKLATKFTFKTNCGVIEVTTAGKKAPITVTSLQTLINAKYYDGTYCHRLTTSGIYVLQCGDPTASGSGSPTGWKGYKDENLPKADGINYPAGTLAMANSGPNTNGSQIFFVYADTHLGPNYSIIGKITKGLDVVQFVASAGAATPDGKGGYLKSPDGLPIQTVSLNKVTAK
jgi:peptidyl-prolyl cis-trans isomerase B (cyclophilin B)